MCATTDGVVGGVQEDASGTAGDDLGTYYSDITAHLDTLLTAARPRLLRLARLQGVAPENADDVVQKTVFAAWRQLSLLRRPDRFDAWLDGICRNLCRAQQRERRVAARYQRRLAATAPATSTYDTEVEWERHEDYGSALSVPDPLEALSHEDLETLLDRALGYLPAHAREVLEACCLEEATHQQVAIRFGLTIGTLEVRLHRVRRRLRDVLSRELRAEAEDLGLYIDEEAAGGWREMREWCFYCGRRRVRGRFEPMGDGRVGLVVRCPACWQKYGVPLCDLRNAPSVSRMHSLGPALKRCLRVVAQRAIQDLTTRNPTCSLCRRNLGRLQVIPSQDHAHARIPGRVWLVAECLTCGPSLSSPLQAIWLDPSVQNFVSEHRRWTYESEVVTQYAGQPALRLRLADCTSSACLTVLAHHETLAVLATFAE
ncbi:MAG: RNA polymerase sigma factor [Ktedonobacterales bacterium]